MIARDLSNLKKSGAGFTLIEVLVYLALFAILIGGAVAAAYNVVEGSGRSQTRAMLQEEGDFLTAKISWALSGAQAINSPPADTPGSILSVTKWDAGIGTVTITLAGADLTLSRAGNPAQILNNSNIQISNLNFTHTFTGGINPESLAADFTLSARTPNGITISQDFSTTNYLRK